MPKKGHQMTQRSSVHRANQRFATSPHGMRIANAAMAVHTKVFRAAAAAGHGPRVAEGKAIMAMQRVFDKGLARANVAKGSILKSVTQKTSTAGKPPVHKSVTHNNVSRKRDGHGRYAGG
jgi:hypothetical protein